MEKSHISNFSNINTNLHECWEVYQKVLEETKTLDNYLDEECSPYSFDDGEEEAEWLQVVGLGELTESWKEGREIQQEELGVALNSLSRAQAEAVKRRVNSLNHTIKHRYNQRQKVRKPDIRDVFKDAEVSSTGTRSRSATPDSLDSTSGETSENILSNLPSAVTIITSHHENSNIPSFVSLFQKNLIENKESLQKLTSTTTDIPNTTSNLNTIPTTTQEIFRRSGHWSHRGDIAGGDSVGIKLTAYQKLGTINLSQPIIQRLNDNDQSKVTNQDLELTEKLNISKDFSLRKNSGSHAIISRSHSSLYGSSRPKEENMITHTLNRTSSHGHLSFEEMCRANEPKNENWNSDNFILDHMYTQRQIELLSQRDLTKLQPLLWLELTAVFDKYNLPLIRRKPNKRRRKSGNLFGVSLSTLLLRDNQLTNEESNIPLVFQKILCELSNRGIMEEGILRIGGHRQKVETLCTELETDFYNKPKEIDNLLKNTPCHDLSVVLKKLLRDLPQPLLTIELIDAFYQTHGIKNCTDLCYSLNLLVLLLPVEHRCTLKALLTFLKLVIDNHNSNKMPIHNVAMIVAPSLFPPNYLYPQDRTNLSAQVNLAATCCQVTEAILMNFDRLWDVPNELYSQLQRHIKEERYRKLKKKYY